MNDYQTLIHQSRYARWLENEGRRETWEETVKRYFDFIEKHCKENLNYILVERAELEEAVLRQDILPSMRALWTAGEAAERDNLCCYNCSFAAVDNLRVFDEVFYVLLQGVGAGFSVEQKHISKLPVVNEHFEYSDTIITVQDTKAG